MKTLIFVHGWATDSSVWEGSAKEFSNSNRVLNINLPSHGGSLKWTEPDLTQAIEEITLAASSSKVIGVGWSLGAQALIAYAAKNPNKVSALILVGATPCFVEKEDFPAGRPRTLVKRMIQDMKKTPLETLKRFYELNFTEGELKKEAAKKFVERYGRHPLFDYAGITKALEALYKTDLREDLASIECPVLVVHGGLDNIAPVGAGKWLASNLKKAELKIFEGSGHAPFLTEKDALNKTLKGFLAKL